MLYDFPCLSSRTGGMIAGKHDAIFHVFENQSRTYVTINRFVYKKLELDLVGVEAKYDDLESLRLPKAQDGSNRAKLV